MNQPNVIGVISDINCQPQDVPILVSARLLKPLGNPLPNGVKYFATAELIELMQGQAWLAKLTNAVTQHWQKKNQHQRAITLMESQAVVVDSLRES
jgi:hypothetical protein